MESSSNHYQTTRYEISIENPPHVRNGMMILEWNGVPQPDRRAIQLIDDGKIHPISLSFIHRVLANRLVLF